MAIEVEYPIRKALGLWSYVKFAVQWSRRYAAEDRYTVVNAVMRDGADKPQSRLLIYDNTRLASLKAICDINGNCLRYKSIPVDSFQLRDTPDDNCIYKQVVQHLDHINRSWRLYQKRTGKDLGIVPERVEFDCYADLTTVIRSTPDIQSPLECVADEYGVVSDDVMANIKQQYSVRVTSAHCRFVVFYGKVRRGVFTKAETIVSLFDCRHHCSTEKHAYASGVAPRYYAIPYLSYWSYTKDPAEIRWIVHHMILPWCKNDDTVDAATEPLELVRYDNGHRCLPCDVLHDVHLRLLLDI